MANPVEQFQIVPKIPLEIAGVDVSFTNSALWMVIGVILPTIFLLIATKRKAMHPNRLQAGAEILYSFVAKMVRDNIGIEGRKYFSFIFTLFLFILMGNLLGLVPYSFTYTSHLAVTGFMALFVFFMVIIFGLVRHGFKFFTLFLPAGVPWWLTPPIIVIEIISFFVKPITLSVRLFANMMAGHLILKVVAGFAIAATGVGTYGFLIGIFPALINVLLIAFEFLVAGIQAYVFAILACVYLKDTIELHH